jgi:hypothetical protein
MASCSENLGPTEPRDYPDQYTFDDHFPVTDVETNTKSIE